MLSSFPVVFFAVVVGSCCADVVVMMMAIFVVGLMLCKSSLDRPWVSILENAGSSREQKKER